MGDTAWTTATAYVRSVQKFCIDRFRCSDLNIVFYIMQKSFSFEKDFFGEAHQIRTGEFCNANVAR